jgi:hypothetical protein
MAVVDDAGIDRLARAVTSVTTAMTVTSKAAVDAVADVVKADTLSTSSPSLVVSTQALSALKRMTARLDKLAKMMVEVAAEATREVQVIEQMAAAPLGPRRRRLNQRQRQRLKLARIQQEGSTPVDDEQLEGVELSQ